MIILTFSSAEEKDKFEHIYEKYKKLLIYKANEVLRDTGLSEDAASEAFIRIYKNLHKIDDPDSGRTVSFIVTIVRNVALSMVKKETAGSHVPLEEFEDTAQDDFDLEGHVLSGISEERIFQLLNSVSDDLRSVFMLKFAHDLSHKEIGKILNISENNVTVRLFRAKKKISELLKKGGFVHEPI